jgi:hypothetical protein
MTWCEKRLSFRAIYILKTIISPRQARDKCRETLKKREPFFEQAALNQGIARQVRDSDDAVIIAATTSPSLLSLLSFMSGTFRWFLVLYLISGSFAWRQMLHRLVQLNSSSMAPEAGGLYNPTRGTVQPVRKHHHHFCDAAVLYVC